MRMKEIALSILIFTLAFGITSAQDPVTPNVSPEARALLKYLYGISGKHILAGQRTGRVRLILNGARPHDRTTARPSSLSQQLLNHS